MRRRWPVPADRLRVGLELRCYLSLFDRHERQCCGRLEAAHVFGRQELRNYPPFWGLDPDVIELMEWDARNGIPACTEHHRRFDSHATPDLILPRDALFDDTLEFISERGIGDLADQRLL